MRGLERGIESVIGDINVSCYVENEAFIIENLVRQMEQGVLAPTPVWANVKTLNWEIFRGLINGIVGGYPCTPFSQAGLQTGVEHPAHLWPSFKRGIGIVKPDWCFFENVANHINIGYEQVRGDLQSLGYTVEEGIFSAEEVGAPHIRRRLFILALDNSLCGRHGRSEKEIRARGKCPVASGEELADASRIGEREPSDQAITIAGNEKTREKSGVRGSELDDAIGSGLQGHAGDDLATGGRQEPDRSIAATSFPMGQGYDQHEWEAPRLESSLGFTINGYNYREDLLRMAGNGVVPQTAALAFSTLLKRFL